MAEDKNYTNNTERPREDEELEIDLMEYVRKLWAARKMLLKVAGIGAIVGVIIALSIPKQYTVEVTLSPESGKSGGTLAPDAKFYVCPAFYLGNDGYAIGDLQKGLDIKNPQLYRIDHAPICKRCDAYQCRRCVWLNRKMTLEINTPSHEQCVISHLERNASQQLLTSIRLAGDFLVGREISTLNYLDPFDNIKE